MTDSFNLFLPLAKVEKNSDGSCTVSGYASTPSLDMDGEIVSLDAVKKALPGYWEWRNIREMHTSSAVGVAKEANVDGNGLFLTSKIVDKAAAQKCLEGVYKGYSIGGKKLHKTGNIITDIELIEVSIVDRPANPDCKINVSKSAKAAEEAYLVKTAKVKNDLSKALKSAAKVSEFLTKANQAPQDGKSPFGKDSKDAVPPQGVESGTWPMKCAAHGIENCAKCEKKAKKKAAKAAGEPIPTVKRDISTDERQHLAHHGDALPDGSFPIKNKEDLSNARQAIGRSKNPDAARALIRRRATELGVKLPDGWKKKEARAMIQKAEEDVSEAARTHKLALSASEFLDLKKAIETSTGDFGEFHFSDHDPTSDFTILRKGTSVRVPSEFDTLDLAQLDLTKELAMSDMNPNLDEFVLDVLKRAAQPSRAQRMGMAQANMKKANAARKECRAGIEEAHKIMKSVYALKFAKKAKTKEDDDELDSSEKVMKALVKAYGELDKVGFYTKAAREQLSKAAGRVGEKEQEAGAPEDGFSVNRNVRDLSQSTLTEGTPPEYPSVSPYPGKMAKYVGKDGKVDANVAELMAENARLAGQAEVFGKVRTSNIRPHLFDTTKIMGGGNGHDVDPLTKAVRDSGVNPELLIPEGEQDNHLARVARAEVAGTYLLKGGAGRSIMDPNFRGGAGK